MARALIQWDGNPGPFNGLVLGAGVVISNDGNGGESDWNYTLLRQPVGSVATLTGSGATRTLIPDKYGTYIVQLIVNNNPALIDLSAAAVLYLPSLLREPVPNETTEWDVEGWGGALTALFERSNHGVGAKPAASSSVHGRLWHTLGTGGVADNFEVCLKDAGDAYNWENLLDNVPGGAAGGDLGGTYPNPTVNDGADSTAIHNNVAGEIAGIALKGTPVAGDFIILEDSEDGGNKKRALVGSISSSGGDVSITSPTDGIVHTGTGSVTQGTSNSTAVSINATSGQITMFGTISPITSESFTVNNSEIGTNSRLFLTVEGTTSANVAPSISYTNIVDGVSFDIKVTNHDGINSTSAALKINFLILNHA